MGVAAVTRGDEPYGAVLVDASGLLLAEAGNSIVTNTVSQTGFNFLPQGNLLLPNTQNVGTSIVGFQGLSTLGTGRISPNNGIGGFVFSAASDAFTTLTACSTVEWSRPPNCLPICTSGSFAASRARYIATCRGTSTARSRDGPSTSFGFTPKAAATRATIRSTPAGVSLSPCGNPS